MLVTEYNLKKYNNRDKLLMEVIRYELVFSKTG